MSLTTPITKSQVLNELQTYGVSGYTAVQAFLREPRQFEKSAPAVLPGEIAGGQTTMQKILADLKVTDNLQWASRKRIRHYTKQLYREGQLG